MKSMKSVGFVVQKILCNLFSMQKVQMLNNLWHCKIKKSVQNNVALIFDVISKNVIAIVRMWLFLEKKNTAN